MLVHRKHSENQQGKNRYHIPILYSKNNTLFLMSYSPTLTWMVKVNKTLHTTYDKMYQGRRLTLVALPSFAILLIIFFVVFSLYVKLPLQASTNSAITLPQPPPSQKNFSILIGILSRADKYDLRHFLRLIYGIQSSPIANIDVKFVFCNLTKPEQRTFIALEIMRFDDIIILNCSENMNMGKTYTYFSSLPRILSHRYDYVMKVDDDVYLRLSPLAMSLEPLPRLDLYYGFVIPCQSMNPYVHYMSGMGFLLSWDLVEWIGKSEIPAKDKFGPEDKMVGQWLNVGNKAKNRFSNKPAMYDYPGTNGRCSHDLIPETVAVHRVKKWDQWLHVLNYFNVTKRLKQQSNHYNV